MFEELVTEIQPDLIWCSSAAAWLALSGPMRQRCVVDLTDQRSVLHREAARIILRRWKRRLYARLGYLAGGMAAPHPIPLERPRDLAKELESMVRWSVFEDRLSRRSLATITCNSTESRQHSRRHDNHWIIPNGFGLLDAPSAPDSDFAGFVLPASFGHPPNIDGAEWFVEAVMPRLRRQLPDAKVTFAGSCPPALHGYEAVAGIQVTGPVASMNPILIPGVVVISPVLGGSGTRLKILEAWARGLPVVSTSKGAEGLGAVDGIDLVIADDPERFAEHCSKLATSPELRYSLGEAGRKRLMSTLSWDKIACEIERRVNQALMSGLTSAAPPPLDNSTLAARRSDADMSESS